MKKVSEYIKNIKNIQNQEDLSEVLEKATKAIDDKLIEMHEEKKESQLDPVIITDEEGNFIDCCNIVKQDEPTDYIAVASVILKGISEAERKIRTRIKRFGIIFYTVLMFIYTVFCISHITDLKSELAVLIFIGLFAVMFIVMTIINIILYKNTKSDSSKTTRQLKIIKNYRSVAMIMRRGMLLWSLGVTVYSMIRTWEEGPAYQVLNILMLIITMLMLMFVLYREIRKISKRSKVKTDSKIKVIIKAIKDTAFKSKTADYISNGDLNIETPKTIQHSPFKAKMKERRDIAKAKKAYKNDYKTQLKEIKEKYLENINNIDKN